MSKNLSETSNQKKQKEIEMIMRARRKAFNKKAANKFGEEYQDIDYGNENNMNMYSREYLTSTNNNNNNYNNNENNNYNNNENNNYNNNENNNYNNNENNNNNNFFYTNADENNYENNNENNDMNNNNFMDYFDESYYLNNTRKSKTGVSEEVAMMNANGMMNENLNDNRNLDRSELLKKKALELETLIVDRVTRDKLADAKRVFSVLEKMHFKYEDDMVSDIYYRVLQSMPKDPIESENVYSYKNNKNNFKEVLQEMNSQDNIRAFNEDNACISSLGDMFEECDLDICSDKCKKKIMAAKEESEKEECSQVVTGYQDDQEIKMQDDIKDTILERLKYCKKVAEMKKGNYELITYSDKQDLKNQTIEEIQEMSRLANMHYNSCYESASKMFSEDEKFKSILNIIKDINFQELSLERLIEIRNDLQTLPTCSMLKFKEHEINRDNNLKEGIRVGKYIIPKNTDYYDQIQGKDRPFVYRDIATDKHYLYDSFSKTLTPFQYPMTQESLERQMDIDAKYDRKIVDEKYLGPSEFSDLYDLDLKFKTNESEDAPAPAPEIILEETPSPSPAGDNNLDIQFDNLVSESDKKVFANLSVKQIIEYLFLIVVIILILTTVSSF